MDNATRHAQRLANNFLEDLDTMQRASRARDRRAMSHFETNMEEPVVRTSLPRRYPLTTTMRMGSVPPGAIPTYRSTTTNYRLPPSVPRTYYKTYRYVTESPYYLTTNTDRIVEPSRPIMTTHYSVAPSPLTQRYTYYYPSPMTSKLYTGSLTNITPEVNAERRRIERRMDDLLEYKLPPPEYYREMRGSLRGLNEKLDEHRRLLDRYSGIDMNAAPSSVGDRIETKFQQLASRMGRRTTAMGRD